MNWIRCNRHITKRRLPDSAWEFSGGAGIASNGSVLGNPDALDGGIQVAFVQPTNSSVAQSLYLDAGTYTLSFMAATYSNFFQSAAVFLDEKQVCDTDTLSNSFLSNSFTTYQVTFSVTSGQHTIEFEATHAQSGRVFIDNVSLLLPVWFTDQGVQYKFTPNGSGGYITPANLFGTLTDNTSSGRTWTDDSGNQMFFNSSGKLVEQVDRFGDGVEITYDANGDAQHVIAVQDGQSVADRSLTFQWCNYGSPSVPVWHINSITDFNNRIWSYRYSNGELVEADAIYDRVTNTEEAAVKYSYDFTDVALHNLLESVTDPNGNVTTFSYYCNRRGFQVTAADGQRPAFRTTFSATRLSSSMPAGNATFDTYDPDGEPTLEVNPDLTTTTYSWGTNSPTDDNGLLACEIDAYGQTEKFGYDPTNGNLLWKTDYMGNATFYQYVTSPIRGDYSLVTQITTPSDDGSGATTYYKYDPSSGELKSVTDAMGDVTTYTYSGTCGTYGLPDSMTNSDADKTNYTYDLNYDPTRRHLRRRTSSYRDHRLWIEHADQGELYL